MKINRLSLFFTLIIDLACSSPNAKLSEANKIHLENSELFQVVENKLDSLQKSEVDNIQKVELQNYRIELETLEESMIEVPGFEQLHQHEGHNHSHETPLNYTDDQILAIQKEIKLELKKLNKFF